MTITYHAGRRLQGLSTDGDIISATFSDDYTTNSGWTQVGSTITVNSGISGKVASISTLDNTTTYMHKALGLTLSDSLWIADFEFQRDSANCNSFAWFVSAGTTFIIGSTQDSIGIGLDGADVRSFAQDGSSRTFGTYISALTTSTNYYFRLERTTTTNLKLSVFTDSDRTAHVSGSPVNQTIVSGVTGLTHLQHSGRNDGGGGASSFRIDNTKIYNGVSSNKVKPTNVQVGSRFEETDTRKIYYGGLPSSELSTTGLKAYWKMNEVSGTLVNSSPSADTLGSSADIQISGATYSQSGILGNALSFDGVNDVGVCGSSVSQFNFMHNTTALWSMNFWVKRITLAQPPVIFTTTSGSTNNIGVWINFVTNNNIDFAIVRGVGGTYVVTNAGTVNIADTTTWHMVTLTYDQSLASLNLKSYLDGTASTTLNKTANAPSNSNATRAPNMFSDANFGYGANLFDEFSIWNRVLTQSEITSLYNSGNGAYMGWSEEV